MCHELFIKLELLIVVIKLTQGGTQVSLCMGAATTYTYSQVSNVSVEQIKKNCNTFTLNNFKLISGAIWLAVFCLFGFFACFYSFFERIFSTNSLKIVFLFNNGVVGIRFFPHFHFFQHGKINKRYITSVNANKEQEPKKV